MQLQQRTRQIVLLPTAKCHARDHRQRQILLPPSFFFFCFPSKMVRTRAQTAIALRQEQLLQGQRLQEQAPPPGPANQVFQCRERRRSQLTCVQGSGKRKTRRATNKNPKNTFRQASRDAPSNRPPPSRHKNPAIVTSDENSSEKSHSDENPSRQAPRDAPSQPSHDPIAFWAETGRWRWPKQHMAHLLARKGDAVPRKRTSSGTSKTPSANSSAASSSGIDNGRVKTTTPYRAARYEALLQGSGSYMYKASVGVAAASQTCCQSLLEKAQPVPADTLFRDDVFEVMCQKMLSKNEARVLRDITPLIVPSAETLYVLGNENCKLLVESTTERWSNSIPVTASLPQPDYAVGFQYEAFSDDKVKLAPYIGDYIAGDLSYFMATYSMCFPFLTCEVKCSGGGLDIADRQNAHSMTLAVRAVVELFRVVGRQDEIDRQILAFSISHDAKSVRMYGHYPVLEGKDTKYYRHPIRNFYFTELDGREKWTAYRFVKNVYDVWAPEHLARIRSAVSQLPAESDLDVAPLDGSGS